ncbi:Fc.00g012750.m01.CDS01 [Cosmosporella sp. VM-42]
MDVDHDFEKSEAQREHSRTTAAIQTAADTMIAVTESFRHQYQQTNGSDYEPRPPKPTYTHSRSSSSSSTSSHRLLDDDPMRQPSLSPLMRAPTSGRQYNVTSVPDVLVPGFPVLTESQSLLQPERDYLEPRIDIPEDLAASIRLSTPTLPPRLDTPHTPPLRSSDLGVPPPEHPQSGVFETSNNRPDSEIQVNHGGLMHAVRQNAAFKSARHQYIALRPDMGTETQRLGTTTRIRAGSDVEPLMSKEVRRKPLAPGARTIEFNHNFTSEILFVAVICLAQTLSMAGLAQGLVPARAIGEAFPERTPGHLAWYSAAYTLTAGAFVLPGTRLGSIFGHKRIFVVGYLWFALWSLLAGLSVYVQNHVGQGTAYFCFCRSMQGIGPALLLPNGQAMLRRAYPPGQRKTLAISLFDATAPVGFVLGAVMASLFAGFADWPWAFYSLATVCVALAALSTLIIPGQNVMMHNLDGSLWGRLDVPALLFGLTGLVLFSVGWNQAPVVSFNTVYTYILIILGALLIIPFVYLETKARHPLVPFRRMQASAGIVLGCTTVGWAAFGVWLWYLVQFLEALRGWTALLLSAGFIPLLISGVISGFLSSHLLTEKPRAHWTILISTLAVLVGSILMATAPEKQSYWFNAFFSILVIPLGMVLSTPAAIPLLADSLPEGHQGLAPGLTATVMGYGISIGLGMAGAVEAHVRDSGGSALEGYRAAQYFGVGLSGLSVLLALGLLAVSCLPR